MELSTNSGNFLVPLPEVPVNHSPTSTTAEGGPIPIDPPSETPSVEESWLSKSRMERLSIYPINRQSYVEVLDSPDFTDFDASTQCVTATQHAGHSRKILFTICENTVNAVLKNSSQLDDIQIYRSSYI